MQNMRRSRGKWFNERREAFSGFSLGNSMSDSGSFDDADEFGQHDGRARKK